MEPQLLHPPPPPLHRISSCYRHLGQPLTGFCASCLRERLACLHPAAATSTHRTNKPSLFRPPNPKHPSSLPELRRCKSFSFTSHAPPPATVVEPQRRSCDVRGRNTLGSLFHLDDQRQAPPFPTSTIEIESQPPNLVFLEHQITPVQPNQGFIKEETVKPMKEHIDLESRKPSSSKDLKEIAGSFWVAASVFSKKLQNWRRKQKPKKHLKTSNSSLTLPEKPMSRIRRFRDTQSEVAEDVSGRRSCDTDPRFSLDAARMSFDNPRFSWDEPRASWDGHLIGARSILLRRDPPTLSVVDDSVVQRSDGLIPIEEAQFTPGGSMQTRDYYEDYPQQRRRRSLDRSNLVQRPAVVFENEDPKPVSNAKVSPAIGSEFFNNVAKFDRKFQDLNSKSLRDDGSKRFSSAYGDNVKGGYAQKKSWRWSKAWNIWGLIHRRSNGGGGRRGNGVARSLSESWPELRREAYNGRMSRSNSSVSSRNSYGGTNGFGNARRNGIEGNGKNKKRREEFVFERSRSARYSPGHLDSGLLRFYLTPVRSNCHGHTRHKSSNSFSRNMLRP